MSFPRHRFPFCSAGFSLIEMAIVLLILTLVVGSSLVPLNAQIEQRQRAETQRTLDEIKEALIGYTLAHNVLPCPSMLSAGIPNGNAIATGNCGLISGSIATGYIPWVTLGVNNRDAWNNLIRYAVSIKFTDPSNPFTLDTASLNSSNTITIQTRDNSGAIVTMSSTIPAVVLSQ
ncbi:MAG: type II secretion system protein, partial [Sulfuriferula sp.]